MTSAKSREVLGRLSRRPRTIGEVARDIGVPRDVVHNRLLRLEKKGLVARTGEPKRDGHTGRMQTTFVATEGASR